MKLQNRPDCIMLVVSLPKPQILAAHLKPKSIGSIANVGDFYPLKRKHNWKLPKVGDVYPLKRKHNWKITKSRGLPSFEK
jgi:hypothetical protein